MLLYYVRRMFSHQVKILTLSYFWFQGQILLIRQRGTCRIGGIPQLGQGSRDVLQKIFQQDQV